MPASGRPLAALPKAHLHLHFTGSMRHSTLVDLARQRGVHLPEALVQQWPPQLSAADERGWFRFQRLYDIARSVVATGKVQPVTEVDIKSKASGIILKLPVNVGERGEPPGEICPRRVLANHESRRYLTHREQRHRGRLACRQHRRRQRPDLPDLNVRVLEFPEAVLQPLELPDDLGLRRPVVKRGEELQRVPQLLAALAQVMQGLGGRVGGDLRARQHAGDFLAAVIGGQRIDAGGDAAALVERVF